MDTAISRSGIKVRAKDAYRGGDYLCSECLIKVIYAAGSTQAPHFKHFPRSPAESARIKTCQFYVAEQQGYGRESAQYIAERSSPPRPRLAFTWAGKDLDRQRWALLVTIPTPPLSVSFLHVDENLNGGVDVPRALALARRSVWVKTRSFQYQVVGYDNSRRPVWCPEPTDQLRTDRANVFDAGVNGGTQLETDDPLVRGRTYLLLSPRTMPKTPPRPVIRPVYRLGACDPKGEWEGHLIYIPASGPAHKT